jgi:hypothetical protein
MTGSASFIDAVMACVLAVVALALSIQPPSASGPPMTSVGSYVEAYAQQLAVVIAEEDYTQQVFDTVTAWNAVPSGSAWNSAPSGALSREREIRRRRLHSEFALLRLPTDEKEWVGIREILDVDGRTISDHTGRLLTLLQQPFQTAIDQLRALDEESARFNIGNIQRDFNVPTFALIFLRPNSQHRCAFEVRRREGTDVVIGYQEVVRPTFIQDGKGNDAPAEGFVRANPVSGAVSATQLVVGRHGGEAHAQIDVQFRNDPKLQLLVPVEMREQYWARSGQRVEGLARYRNFKRFEVDASWKVRPQ